MEEQPRQNATKKKKRETCCSRIRTGPEPKNNRKDKRVAHQQHNRVNYAPKESNEGTYISRPQIPHDKCANEASLEIDLLQEIGEYHPWCYDLKSQFAHSHVQASLKPRIIANRGTAKVKNRNREVVVAVLPDIVFCSCRDAALPISLSGLGPRIGAHTVQ